MIKLRDLIILFIIYKLFNLNIIGKIIDVILPFILAFVLAFTLYPCLKKLNRIFSKYISVIIIIFLFGLSLFIFIYLIVPVLIKESNTLITIIIKVINELSLKYQINTNNIISRLSNINYKDILNGISISIDYITKVVLFFISFIYFIIDIDKIEKYIKGLNNHELFNYLQCISRDVSSYMGGIIKICIISFFEYGISFYIIGHSNYLLMGLVAAISNLIPCVGCIFILIVGIISSPQLIVKISILYLILSNVDGYIINPYIFGKTNNIHPLVNLIGMSIGGVIFGIKGVLLSLPITIILITSYRYFRKKISWNILEYIKK